MFWTKDHDVILCREVLVANPYEFKKSSTQRSQVWEQIADILNKCSSPTFNVDKRSVRDHVGILQNRQKKKVRAEERATGIAPDEPSELDNLLEQIISLEESTESDDKAKADKAKADKAKAEDVRMKAMEKLSQTKKRELAEGGDSKRKRQRRSGGDAMALLTERAERNYEIREKELGLKREKQEMERKQLEVTAQQQLQLKQQQADMMKVMQQQQQQYQQQQMLLMQQQQQQAASLMGLLNKLLNK